MRLTFLGAAHEVTGSCTLLEACGKRILIDCGLEQGPDTYENADLPVLPMQIDAVVVTHAHIDHSGKLPLLVSRGYKGPIYSTVATQKLCSVMLLDSAHIQEFEAEWKNRKAKRSGKPPVVPLYSMEDAEATMQYFKSFLYNEEQEIFPGVMLKFTDAGHLLGSSSVTLTLTENEKTTKIVFSGDIGNTNQPIIRDPQYLEEADYVVTESTYGDRSHGKRLDYISQLVPILQRTFDRGGNVVIPSFAVGRTQELLYFLRIIKAENLIKGHPHFPVYVDSPLAVEATNIFNDSQSDFDEEATKMIQAGINPLSFPDLRLSITSDDSKLINADKTPKVILSASGMCEAGRIRHHLKHNLWQENSTILFVGYQAEGTLGRAIADGAEEVHLFGEPVQINAEICRLKGISGHADNEGLLRWMQSFKEKPRHVFVNHGGDETCEHYVERLRNELILDVHAPYSGEVYDLDNNCILKEGNKQKIVREAPFEQGGKHYRVNPVYTRLASAGEKLQAVIAHNEGGANKDLAKFADQILALCQKWDR